MRHWIGATVAAAAWLFAMSSAQDKGQCKNSAAECSLNDSRRFPVCDNCSSFVNCGGRGASGVNHCPGDLLFDVSTENCNYPHLALTGCLSTATQVIKTSASATSKSTKTASRTTPQLTQATFPHTTAVRSTSPESTATLSTSPDTTAAPSTSPDTTADPSTSPDTTAALSTSSDMTAAPSTSPESTAAVSTSPDSTAAPSTSPAALSTSPVTTAAVSTSPDTIAVRSTSTDRIPVGNTTAALTEPESTTAPNASHFTSAGPDTTSVPAVNEAISSQSIRNLSRLVTDLPAEEAVAAEDPGLDIVLDCISSCDEARREGFYSACKSCQYYFACFRTTRLQLRCHGAEKWDNSATKCLPQSSTCNPIPNTK